MLWRKVNNQSNNYLRDGPHSYQRKLGKKTTPTTPSPIDAPAPSPSVLSVTNIINGNVPASSPIYYNDKIEFTMTNVSPLEDGQFVEFSLACNEVGATKIQRVYTLSGDGHAAVLVPNKLNSDRPVRPLVGGLTQFSDCNSTTCDGWLGSWSPFENDDGPGCDDNQPRSCEVCDGAVSASCTVTTKTRVQKKIKGKLTWIEVALLDSLSFGTEIGPRVPGDCFCDDAYDICNCANGCSPSSYCWYNTYGLCSDQYKCCT